MLIQQMNEDRAIMLKNLKNKNRQGLKSVTHKLLGALSYCGAPRLESACQNLYASLEHVDDVYMLKAATLVLQEMDLLQQAYISEGIYKMPVP